MSTPTKATKRTATAQAAKAKPVQQRVMQNDSRPNRISLLDLGESESLAVRLGLDETSQSDIEAVVTNIKGTMSKAAERASERTGNTYTTETITALTRSNDIMVVAVVTRTN